MLDLSGVTAGYGARGPDGLPIVRAVSDINLQLKRGTNLGIIGESGSGKSSLARVIAGILPGAGTITFNGTRLGAGIADRPRDVLRAIQIVFQHADTALNPAIAVGDILARPMQFYGMRDARARSAEVDRLLDMVRLPRAVRHRRPGELSGGQKQRVNFARALAAQPKLILCDEITSALDTVVASAVIDLLKELQTELGLSYIFISHDLSVVEAICDEVAVMFKGEVVERLPVNGLSGASHPYSRLLFRSIPQLDPTWLDGLDMDTASAPASSLQRHHDFALDAPG
ncbi:MAG: ABC transporter ATP-binding protein [Janthinobacterium lividum]